MSKGHRQRNAQGGTAQQNQGVCEMEQPGSNVSCDGTFVIEITLRSDLCCGTGEANGVAVDQVTATDQLGLPVIPGKRLKGLLREQADIVATAPMVDALFGRAGESQGKLVFSDARVEGYDELLRLIKEEQDPPARVARAFTITRTQTRVDADGVAADSSLRTIELVRRCDAEGEPTRFRCRVLAQGINQDEREAFRDAVRCLRAIGLGKTRGLGEVSCKASWQRAGQLNDSGTTVRTADDGADELVVPYRIRLLSDAVLQGGPAGPLDYVPGSALQGVFAREFSQRDPAFFQAHVLRNTRFSNAYPDLAETPGGEGIPSEPVPRTWRTMKNASALVPNGALPLYDAATGYRPEKPVQQVALSGYAAMGNCTLVGGPDASLSFHSSSRSSRQGQQFYSMRSLNAGQSFSGTITAVPEAIEAFRAAVARHGGRFALGTATHAGYGACAIEIGLKAKQTRTVYLRAGERVAIRLASDLAYVDGQGNNVCDVDSLARWLSGSGALGFPFRAELGASPEDCQAYMGEVVVGGFNSHWRLPKRQLIAFAKGSVLIVTVCTGPDGISEYEVPATAWVGLMQTEGFGQVRVEKVGSAVKRSYAKGHPTPRILVDPLQGTGHNDEDAAVRSFRRELAFQDACDKAELRGVELADACFDKLSASKSSAMRVRSVLGSARRSCIEGGRRGELSCEFSSIAARALHDSDPALDDACQGLTDACGELVKADPPLGEVQQDIVFECLANSFVRTLKQAFSLKEGGRHA